MSGNQWQILRAADQAKPGEVLDKLISVTNGLGAIDKVTYANANDSSVYTPQAQLPNGQDAVQGKRSFPHRPLIKTSAHSNGQGGWIETDYRYAGYAVDGQGRGSLGFAKVESTQRQTGLKNTSWLAQSFPHTGTVLFAQTQSYGGVMLSDSQTTPALVKLTQTNGVPTYLPYIRKPSTNPNLPKPKEIVQALTFQNESEWRCKSENGLRI